MTIPIRVAFLHMAWLFDYPDIAVSFRDGDGLHIVRICRGYINWQAFADWYREEFIERVMRAAEPVLLKQIKTVP